MSVGMQEAAAATWIKVYLGHLKDMGSEMLTFWSSYYSVFPMEQIQTYGRIIISSSMQPYSDCQQQ